MDEGDDGDDDDGDSSGDDPDDEDEDEEEEEEHLALADSAVVIPTDELVSPPAMPTLSPSPLTSLLPPSAGERLARCMAPTALPSPPLPPPLHMPPPVDRRDDIPETEMPHRKSTLDAEARRGRIGEVGYGIRDTWIDPAETVPEIASMTMGDRVDLLMEDKIAHQETIQIVEDEAYAAREAWLQTHQTQLQLQSTLIQTQHQLHETRFQMQQTEIAKLRETDRRRQAQMTETPRVMGDMRRETGDMQAELLALHEQPRRARQPGGDARVPNHRDHPRDADSHI
nr:hypothetical protein [Tanacetum cinerariifolium]